RRRRSLWRQRRRRGLAQFDAGEHRQRGGPRHRGPHSRGAAHAGARVARPSEQKTEDGGSRIEDREIRKRSSKQSKFEKPKSKIVMIPLRRSTSHQPKDTAEAYEK